MRKIINNKIILINTIVCILILLLPYYLFEGKLFIGGDDTRLLYVYPWEFLTNISFFSWYNFSSVGSFNPNQFSLPFTAVWSILATIIPSKFIIDYLSFSLPLLLGYLYFQKLAGEILGKASGQLEIGIGAMLYIFSPILIYNQLSVFLYAAWLIGLLPILSYYYLRYLRLEQKLDIFKACLFSIWLSLALFSIPWLLGFILPVFIGFIFSTTFYKRKAIFYVVKKSLVFLTFLFITQLFWLLPFVMSFFGGGNNFGGKVLSQQVADTFKSTVLATASGNPLFPFINLFHRQIAFDYNWGLRSVYEIFYDKILIINIVYIILFFGGIFFVKKVLDKMELIQYTTLLISFITSLFFYTVNIGPLKELFLALGSLPGMVMFRNFYDKFALGYTLLFALLMTYSLVIIAKRFPSKRYLFAGIIALVSLINLLPIKDTIVRPLWKTTDIYSNITIPTEYTDFMNQVMITTPVSTNIMTLPYNIASYSIIKDESSNNVFAGTSPVKVFSGINDYAGYLSFPSYEAGLVDKYIKERDYQNLQEVFKKYNISYLFVTNNVPQTVKDSYLFNKTVLPSQDEDFIANLSEKKLITSKKNNYVLYALKQPQSTIQPQNIIYKRINPTTYRIHISHMPSKQKLIFLESYHKQWKLYPISYSNHEWCSNFYPKDKLQQECQSELQLFTSNAWSALLQRPFFVSTHKIYNERNNQWIIDQQTIKNLGDSYYKTNNDGTIDVEFVLYFLPQSYFYLGQLISIGTIAALFVLILKKKHYEKMV